MNGRWESTLILTDWPAPPAPGWGCLWASDRHLEDRDWAEPAPCLSQDIFLAAFCTDSEIRLSHLLGLVERSLSNTDLKKLYQTSSLLIVLKQLSICEHQFPGKPWVSRRGSYCGENFDYNSFLTLARYLYINEWSTVNHVFPPASKMKARCVDSIQPLHWFPLLTGSVYK